MMQRSVDPSCQHAAERTSLVTVVTEPDSLATVTRTDDSIDCTTSDSVSMDVNKRKDPCSVETNTDVKASTSNSDPVSVATVPSPNDLQSNQDSVSIQDRYQSTCKCLCQFLERQADDYFQPYMLEEKYFRRFWVLDIVTRHSSITCCFTKR